MKKDIVDARGQRLLTVEDLAAGEQSGIIATFQAVDDAVLNAEIRGASHLAEKFTYAMKFNKGKPGERTVIGLGVNGVNEMVRNFDPSGEHDITSDWGRALALRLLDHVRARMVEFQAETGHMYNLEATPAEGTTYRFAKEDRKRYPAIRQAGTAEMPYYTNSSQLPVGYTDDPFEALEQQDELQRKYTGGTVLHLYMTEALTSADACRSLVRRALGRFRLPYITVTPTFSICPKHGYLNGSHPYCPKCDAELLARKQALSV